MDIAYGFDHVPFSNTSGLPPESGGQSGLHKVVHLLANSTLATNPPDNYPIVPPAPVGLTGELFTTQSNDGINPDEILWYQTGGGKLTQMSRNFLPVNNGNGATFLPGGLILNWGIYNASGGNFSSGSTTNNSGGESSLVLTQSFPNNLYLVGGNLTYTTANLPSGTGTLNVRKSQLSSGPITNLSWQVYCNTNNYLGFVWWALGN